MTEIGLTEEQISAMLDDQGKPVTAQDLTSDDLITLTDFERQTMANLSSVLNAMTGAEYTVVKVEYAKTSAEELPTLLGEDLIFGVSIDIGETFKHFIVLEKPFARAVAASLTGGEVSETAELGEMEMSTVQEVVSQANGTYLSNLGTALSIKATGEAVELADAGSVAGEIGEFPLLGTLTMRSGAAVSIQLRHLIPGRLGALILNKVRPTPKPAPVAGQPVPEPAAGTQVQPSAPTTAPEQVAPAVATAPVSSGSIKGPTTEFKPASFSQLVPRGEQADTRNLDILLDVPLLVTVELGKTQIPIRQILEYGQGSLITLDKLAGEPIDLLVNGKYFAKGEVVVIDENFGVRITSILSPAERIAQLS